MTPEEFNSVLSVLWETVSRHRKENRPCNVKACGACRGRGFRKTHCARQVPACQFASELELELRGRFQIVIYDETK